MGDTEEELAKTYMLKATAFMEEVVQPLVETGSLEEEHYKGGWASYQGLHQLWSKSSAARLRALETQLDLAVYATEKAKGKKRWARFDKTILLSYIAKNMSTEKMREAIDVVHQARKVKKRRIVLDMAEPAREMAESMLTVEQELSDEDGEEDDTELDETLTAAQAAAALPCAQRAHLEMRMMEVLQEVNAASRMELPEHLVRKSAKLLIASFGAMRGTPDNPEPVSSDEAAASSANAP